MRVFQAPMEGVIDFHTRALLCGLGGLDGGVTEFLRVTDRLLPRKVFLRLCPELDQSSRTADGTPIALQLLGSDPAALAANALRGAEFGASAIDLNFGCPAKTVNRHGGGACLLTEPRLIGRIVGAVREALPSEVPVTVKMRLGYRERSQALNIARAIESAGADQLVVHARSASDGYTPPAYWEELAPIRQVLSIAVIANGEIWTPDDCQRCRQTSECEDVMIGRGLLARPGLPGELRGGARLSWVEVVPLLRHFFEATSDFYPSKHLGNRLKQWLAYLRREHPQAQPLFETIKRSRNRDFIRAALDAAPTLCAPAA